MFHCIGKTETYLKVSILNMRSVRVAIAAKFLGLILSFGELMSEFMELNEGKKGISSPSVPLIREDTVTGQIRHEMGFSGNGVIPSLAYVFLVVNTRIICSGHKKATPLLIYVPFGDPEGIPFSELRSFSSP